MSRSNFPQPFPPDELGPVRLSSNNEVVDDDSVSIADSNASSCTERVTVIPAYVNTLTRGENPSESQFHLAVEANRSMSPATPSPPASPNVQQRKRKTPPASAVSKSSVQSQPAAEDTTEDIDRSRCVLQQYDTSTLLQPGTPPPTAAATNSVSSSLSPAPAIKVTKFNEYVASCYVSLYQ